MSYGGGAKCTVCTKAVYAADPKVQADGKTWHAPCFTCKECKSQITLAKWAQLEGENFCKPCFKKVFMLRGKYSDVAGAPPAKKEEAAGAAAAAAPAAAPTAAAEPAAASATVAAAASGAAAASAVTAAAVKPGAWVPKAPAEGAAGADSKYGGGKKCAVCTKSVYSADPKVEADGKIWHASCFKCEECKSNITLAKWAQLEGRNFCKVCFAKIFSLRGKYDDVKEGVHVPASTKAAGGGAAEPAAAAAAAAAPAPAAKAPEPAAEAAAEPAAAEPAAAEPAAAAEAASS